MKRIFVVFCLSLFFCSAAQAAVTLTRSGSGTQEDTPAGFTVKMWCSGAGPTSKTTLPPNQLVFGVAATQAPFVRQGFSPAYTDNTYGCGSVDEVEIETTGSVVGSARDQAAIKYGLAGSGVTAANFVSATLTGLRVNDFYRTAGIATNMAVGVYDLQAGDKATGTVVTNVKYARGTKMGELSVASLVGATYSADVSAAVLADLNAGRNFSGFLLYPETPRSGLEEISFDYPTLVINTSADIPTVTEWGMIVLGLLFALFAIWQIRRTRKDPLAG